MTHQSTSSALLEQEARILAPHGIACRSCPKKPYPWPAAYIASAKRINDLPPVDWPVCESHMHHAMVAGWFPIRKIEDDPEAAAALRSRTTGAER